MGIRLNLGCLFWRHPWEYRDPTKDLRQIRKCAKCGQAEAFSPNFPFWVRIGSRGRLWRKTV